MAFFIFKSLFQSPHNSIMTTTIPVVLLSAMAAHVASSAPTTETISDSSVDIQDLIEQVFNGVEILIKLGSHLNGTILDIEDSQNVSLINNINKLVHA